MRRYFLALGACAAAIASPPSHAAWPEPLRTGVGVEQADLLLSIGVESGDSAAEFSGVTSALRLSSGAIVIANGGSSQLRWFSTSGAFIRSVGRRGQGPNEFGRSIYIYDIAGDTVVVLDQSNRRFHYLDRNGAFVRTDTLGDRRRMAWLHDRVVVERLPKSASIERLASVIAGIPFGPADLALRAIPDEAGNLWVQERSSSNTWMLRGPAGRTHGSVTVPPGFQPFQIGDSTMLGIHRDSLGVERIQLRRFRHAVAQVGAVRTQVGRVRYDAEAERANHTPLIQAMLATTANLVTAQEIYFASNKRYAGRVADLGQSVPEGFKVDIVRSGADGHWFIASAPGIRTTCVTALGKEWPMGLVRLCG